LSCIRAMSGSGNALLAPQSNGRQPLVVNN